MVYGSIWVHIGPYGWPEVKTTTGTSKQQITVIRVFSGVVSGGEYSIPEKSHRIAILMVPLIKLR